MLLTIIVMLFAGLFMGSLESNLTEVFKDPEWMDIKEWEYRL